MIILAQPEDIAAVETVGQNLQAKASDKRAEDTYNDAAAVLHEALEITTDDAPVRRAQSAATQPVKYIGRNRVCSGS